MPHIGVRDLRVYHEVAGAGPPVLVISGSGADLRHAPHERHPLAQQFEVIGYDQRGLGRTSKPDVAYSMADYADDAAALLDALGVERAHVVGISFGGMVAQHLVLGHPDRVQRLVLACTSPGGPEYASADLLSLSRLPEAERGPAHLALFDTRCQPGAPIPDDLRPILKARANRPAVTDPVAVMGARRQLEARADHDVGDRLGEIASPTLVIGGVHDGIAPVRNLELIAERIPDARLVICDGGHLFFLQDRSAWPTVIEFLRA